MKRITIRLPESQLDMLKKMVDEASIPDIDYGIRLAVRKWIRKNSYLLEF